MAQTEAPEFELVDLSNWETVPEKGIENEFDKISLTTEESIILDDEENIEEVESFTQGSVTLKARDDTAMTEMVEEAEIKEEEGKQAELFGQNRTTPAEVTPKCGLV